MTGKDLFHAWWVIEQIAKAEGISPSEARGKIKAQLAKVWEDEECGKDTLQTLHENFSSLPSVEAFLTCMADLATESFGEGL